MTFKTKVLHNLKNIKEEYINEPRHLKQIEMNAYHENYMKLAEAEATKRGIARARAKVRNKPLHKLGKRFMKSFTDNSKRKSVWGF